MTSDPMSPCIICHAESRRAAAEDDRLCTACAAAPSLYAEAVGGVVKLSAPVRRIRPAGEFTPRQVRRELQHRPKQYFDNGRTLEWGKSLTPEHLSAMDDGEIFTLLSTFGSPVSRVLKDSYGTIREQRFFYDEQTECASVIEGILSGRIRI